MMRFGLKPKILLVLVGILLLTTILHAALAAYFTNRQNEASAFADLGRDVIEWQHDLESLKERLNRVALDAVSDAVALNQLQDLVAMEYEVAQASGANELQDAVRALAYRKSVSLGRLDLVRRSAGFSSIAVYVNGRLSHYLSATEAGMLLPRAANQEVWLATGVDRSGSLPLQKWPSWARSSRPATTPAPMPELQQPTISLEFFTPQSTTLQIAVPVAGLIQNRPAEPQVQSAERIVSAPTIAPATGADPAEPPVTFSVVVFRKEIDRAFLQEIAKKTGKWPALFTPDGRHRQQLLDFNVDPAHLMRTLGDTATRDAAPTLIQRTAAVGQSSAYEVFVPWQLAGQPPLILGLATSRETTLRNIRETTLGLVVVAGVILLVSIGIGAFGVGRLIDPIVALTRTVKKMSDSPPISIHELQPIRIQAPDEIGELTTAFNAMIGELRRSIETLELHVQERTADLRQQTRYLRTLIDTLPVQVWLKDTESRFLAVNQACAWSAGHPVEELVGKTDLDFFPRELAEAYRADDSTVMQTRRPKKIEEPIVTPSGTYWIETDKAPVIDEDGTVLGTVGVGRDISERKAVEAAREAALAEAVRLARLRSEFLAKMSHELRTPLNAILGYTQILERDPNLRAQQAASLATIRLSGQHLLTLINDVLDLARIDAEKVQLVTSDIRLTDFLEIVADIIRIKADQRRLRFIYEPAPNLPLVVRGDEKRLRQVLLNLLGNAVKFTERGHIALRVQASGAAAAREPARDDEPARVRVRFEVQDTGIGMTAEQLSRLFEPFEQLADEPWREGGAGLGLAISRQLVRAMGSDIEVRSTPDVGTVFSFELEMAVGIAVASATPPPVIRGYRGPRRTLLIVDDSARNRAMLMELLTMLGFVVATADDGRDAVTQAERLHPDLILMDVMIPVMDGLEAMRRMRCLPQLEHVPIIAVSASASAEDASRSRAAGATGFLTKPVDHHDLLRMIGDLLGLDWRYDQADDASRAPSRVDTEELVIPSPEEMQVLHRLALMGNMREMRERADYLKRVDPRHTRFANQLSSLAQGYQSQALLALIEQHLTPTADTHQR